MLMAMLLESPAVDGTYPVQEHPKLLEITVLPISYSGGDSFSYSLPEDVIGVRSMPSRHAKLYLERLLGLEPNETLSYAVDKELDWEEIGEKFEQFIATQLKSTTVKFRDTLPLEGDDLDDLSEALSPSEALYGFAGWLTIRDTPVTMSATHDAAEVARLVDEFCQVNELEAPRDHWERDLVPMVDAEYIDTQFTSRYEEN